MNLLIPSPIRTLAAAVGNYLDNPDLSPVRKLATVVIGIVVGVEIVSNC